MNYKNKVKTICDEITSRIQNIHISCFKDIDKPLFLISEQYPGVWIKKTQLHIKTKTFPCSSEQGNVFDYRFIPYSII